MLQKLIIIGRLGTDPDLRYTNSGMAVCTISVAADRNYKQDNEWKTKTTWFKVTCWGTTGENVNKYLTKGSLVYIEGYLKKGKCYQHTRGEHQGEWDYSLEATADTVKFLDSKKTGDKPTEEELAF